MPFALTEAIRLWFAWSSILLTATRRRPNRRPCPSSKASSRLSAIIYRRRIGQVASLETQSQADQIGSRRNEMRPAEGRQEVVERDSIGNVHDRELGSDRYLLDFEQLIFSC